MSRYAIPFQIIKFRVAAYDKKEQKMVFKDPKRPESDFLR